MHPELLHRYAHQRLQDLRREAGMRPQAKPLRKRLARALERLALRLEPGATQHVHPAPEHRTSHA